MSLSAVSPSPARGARARRVPRHTFLVDLRGAEDPDAGEDGEEQEGQGLVVPLSRYLRLSGAELAKTSKSQVSARGHCQAP